VSGNESEPGGAQGTSLATGDRSLAAHGRGGGALAPARRGVPAAVGAGVGVVGVGLCAVALLHVAPFATLFVGLAAVACGGGMLALRYATSGPAAQAAREREAKDRDEAARRARFAAAKKLLYAVPTSAKARPLAAKALAQIDLVGTLETGCHALLARKFEVGEMTQVRYVQAIDAATEAVASSLDELATRLAAAAAGEKAGDAADEATATRLAAANDAALAALRGVHDALAAIRTSREGASVEVETAIATLTDLAARAKLFDVRG
jgi:hypothetical protein